jgi:hypothetical protein
MHWLGESSMTVALMRLYLAIRPGSLRPRVECTDTWRFVELASKSTSVRGMMFIL